MIHYITTSGAGDAWVANELHELDGNAIPYVLHAMRAPQRTYHSSRWVQVLMDKTRCLYPLPTFGVLVSAVLAPFKFRRNFFAAFLNALLGERESLRGRVAAISHFFVACHWARLLQRERVDHIHSQWAHSCATIGMYAAWLLNKSFSFTGHACDLFRDRVALNDKIRRAEFIVCISTFHKEFFLDHKARHEQLLLVYCGIDPSVFTADKVEKRALDQSLHIRASCRLVEKKGLRYLIDACQILAAQGINFECTIAGSGPLEGELRSHISRLGLGSRITITGTAIQQEDIPEFMQSGDIYCLPCIWASDKDVDGLPQMLMEAMACGLPVISTRLVGIPDLVINEQTGLLVEPNSAEETAAALLKLYRDRGLRERLAIAGREHVLRRFDIHECLEPLIGRYRSKLDHGTETQSGHLAQSHS